MNLIVIHIPFSRNLYLEVHFRVKEKYNLISSILKLMNYVNIKYLIFFVGTQPTKPKDIECPLENLKIKLLAGSLVEQTVKFPIFHFKPYIYMNVRKFF